MKLQRESINLGSEYNGKWNFVIMDSDADKIEAVEEALCEMATGFSVGGEEKTWGDYCDQCPCYDDGYGSGFWIPVEDVPAFKEAYKAAKKSIK
nr:unknown function [Klebsiella phage vB_Kpn_K2064PH2]